MARHENTAKENRDSGVERSVRSLQDLGTDAANDIGRFVQAAVEANTEFAVGWIQVTSDLIVNLAESSVPRRSETGDKGRDVTRVYTDTVSNVARHVNTAFADSAKVIQRSADKFASIFDSEEETSGERSKKRSTAEAVHET